MEWIEKGNKGYVDVFVDNDGKVLVKFTRNMEADDSEDQYTYLLNSGIFKGEVDLLDTDVRVVVQQWDNPKTPITESWDLTLTKAEKLTNILLGVENVHN